MSCRAAWASYISTEIPPFSESVTFFSKCKGLLDPKSNPASVPIFTPSLSVMTISINRRMSPRACSDKRAKTSSADIVFSLSLDSTAWAISLTFINWQPFTAGCLYPALRAASLAFQQRRYSSTNTRCLLLSSISLNAPTPATSIAGADPRSRAGLGFSPALAGV